MMTKVGVKPSKYICTYVYAHAYVCTHTNKFGTDLRMQAHRQQQTVCMYVYLHMSLTSHMHARIAYYVHTYIHTYIHMHTVPVGWKVYPVRGCSAHAVCLLPPFPTLHQLSSGKRRVFCQQGQWPVSGRHAHRGVTQLGLDNTKTAFHQTQTHGLPHQQPLQIAKDKYKTGNNLFTELS